MNLSQETLSYGSQLKATVLLILGFMMILTSYMSVEGIVTKFYKSSGHQYYGRISLITIYAVLALSTTYSSVIIQTLGYKMVFICGALCYVALNSSALIIYISNSQVVAIGTILITSSLCGLAAGTSGQAIILILDKLHQNKTLV